MSKRGKQKAKEVDFDLTPLIDVTFQLLIFFMVVMKIKQIERRQAANLPADSGPSQDEAEKVEQLTLRLFWRNNKMIYEIGTKFGNNQGAGANAIPAGDLPTLMQDRQHPDHPHYRDVFNRLTESFRSQLARVPTAKKVEIAMDENTQESSALHPGKTAPWGFVTLALDACTQINIERKEQLGPDKELSITFKNTSPAGPERIAGS